MTRELDTGRYTHEGNHPCVCGHSLGEHTANAAKGDRPCLHGTGVNSTPIGEPCACACFAPTAFVRCGSHRAREKLYGACGRVQSYFPGFAQKSRSHIYAVPPEKLASALKITGVTKARWAEHYARTWSMK